MTFKAISLAVCGLALCATPGWAVETILTGTGLPEELSESLKAASLTAALPEAADGQDTLAAAQADYARLVATLYDAGYFGPTIRISVDGREAASIDPISPPASVAQVRIEVEPGPRFTMGQTQIGPLAQDTELPSGFAPGQVASTSALRQAVDSGIEGWRDVGHAKARLASQEVTANHPARQLNTRIVLDPGPRLNFGDLRIVSPSAVREERILEIAGLPTGRVFSPEERLKAATRLRRTGAFSSVSLTEAEEIGPDATLDIIAQVVDAPPRRIGFGGELSTQDGLSLSGFWLHRNYFGGAERLRFEGEITGIGGDTGGADYRLSSRFTRPSTVSPDADFFLFGEIERVDDVAFELDQITLEAGFTRFVSDNLEQTFAVGLQTAQTIDAFGARDYTLLTLPVGIKLEYRDVPLDATEGFFAEITATPFLGITGTESGLRTTADLRGYLTLGETRPVTLAGRAQFGSLTGASLATAPSDFLFFSGGGGSVRGHGFQSLGVDLGGGRIVGGRGYLGFSGEVRVRMTETIGLVAFIDAGYVGAESFPNGTDGEWHSGAGFGLRYNTGIGPIRVDIAAPTSGPGDPTGLQLYIGIGQAF